MRPIRAPRARTGPAPRAPRAGADTPLGSGDQLFASVRSWLSRNPGVVGGFAAAVLGLTATFTR